MDRPKQNHNRRNHKDDQWQLKIVGQIRLQSLCVDHLPAGTHAEFLISKIEQLLGDFTPSCPTPVIHESLLLTGNLLLVLLASIVITTLLGGLGLLPPDTAGTTATEWRGQGEVDVLLGVEADHEGRNVDNLLADTAKLLVSRKYSNIASSTYRM